MLGFFLFCFVFNNVPTNNGKVLDSPLNIHTLMCPVISHFLFLDKWVWATTELL